MTDGRHQDPSPRHLAARAFYDDLARTYHLLYPDWDAAVRDQGRVLDGVLRRLVGTAPHGVLDCAVGIGTQALGLAAQGHRVVGTDVSTGALGRARREAARRGLTLALAAGDMRRLPFASGVVDAVVCVDALAHMSSLEEAARALGEMARVARPGGGVVVTLRDYEVARRDRLPGTLPQVHRGADAEALAVQVWDWHPGGRRYDLTHLVLTRGAQGWSVTTLAATLSAFVRDELVGAAETAGLVDVEWRAPGETGFFQPMLLGRVRGSAPRWGGSGPPASRPGRSGAGQAWRPPAP